MIKLRQFSSLIIGLLICEITWSHALLRLAPAVSGDPTFNSPIPRDNKDGYKLSQGALVPCGNNTGKSPTLQTYTVGQSVKFEWQETVQHTGVFIFQISADGGPFTKFAQFVDNQDGGPATLPHSYTQTFALPAGVTCNACTIRFIQQMDSTVDNGIIDTNDYFTCADVRIANADGTFPAPSNSGQASQSSAAAEEKFTTPNACGFIRSDLDGAGSSSTGLYISLVMALFFFPLVLISSLRLQRVVRRRRR